MSGLYDGNLAALEEKESADARWLRSRPICDMCGEPIQDDHYYEEDGPVCPRCYEKVIEDRRRYIDE